MQRVARLSPFAFFLVFALSLRAGEVVISQVEFRLVDQPGRDDRWYQIEVELEVDRGGPPELRDPRFMDEVSVRVALSFETQREEGHGFEFYASEVMFPTLEVGDHVARFYLPPEIAERDRIRGEPYAFEASATSLSGSESRLLSRNLDDAAALDRFRALVAENAPATEGVLLPQHLTPFWLSYPDDSPSPVCGRVRD